MHTPDHYVLALAMLDGDRDARKVLADMLEESGERGLAQWARTGRNKSENRLDFALMLLPVAEAVRLGASFLDECLAARVLRPRLNLRASPAVQHWLAGQATDYVLQNELHQLLMEIERNTTVQEHFCSREPLAKLGLAIECLISARECLKTGNTQKAHHWELEARQNVRLVSYYTRRGTNVLGQIAQVKALFTRLLDSQDPTWPK